MRINTNISAIIANNQLSKVQDNLQASLERLSSGYKINNASDDPAGMAISQKMRTQLRGLDQATNNAADGVSVIETAEGAISEIQSMLSRMKELSVQAANDTNSDTERSTIQQELESLNSEIDRIAKDTEFNGQPLINGNLERRVYSDVRGISQLECSSNIQAGKYGISITQDARQAVAAGTVITGAGLSSGAVTAAMAGSISVNGYSVTVSEGDTLNTIVKNLMDATDKIGGSVMLVDDTSNTTGTNPSTAGYTAATNLTQGVSSLVFMTNSYGANERLDITCSNASLASALGLDEAVTADGMVSEGLDVKADFLLDASSNRIGFSNTANISTDGTKVIVNDTDSRTFMVDVPGSVAGTVFDDSGIKATGTTASPKGITQEVTDIGTMAVHVGANENQTIDIDIQKISTYTIGLDKINVMTQSNASKAIESVDEALAKVSAIRSKLGAYQNRLDHTTSNLGISNDNLTASLSRIVDTDMAEEMTTYTQQNVLSQAATSMLAQANARPETVLQLLQK